MASVIEYEGRLQDLPLRVRVVSGLRSSTVRVFIDDTVITEGAFMAGRQELSGSAMTASGPTEIRVAALRPKFTDMFRLDRLLAVSAGGRSVAMHVVRAPWIQLQPLWLQPILLLGATGVPVYGALRGADALGIQPGLSVLLTFGLFTLASRLLGRSTGVSTRINEPRRSHDIFRGSTHE